MGSPYLEAPESQRLTKLRSEKQNELLAYQSFHIKNQTAVEDGTVLEEEGAAQVFHETSKE